MDWGSLALLIGMQLSIDAAAEYAPGVVAQTPPGEVSQTKELKATLEARRRCLSIRSDDLASKLLTEQPEPPYPRIRRAGSVAGQSAGPGGKSLRRPGVIPHEVVHDSRVCYWPQAGFGVRFVSVYIEAKDFSLSALRTLVRNLSVRFDRREDVTVSIETDKEILDWSLAYHPGPVQGRLVADPESERLRNKRVLRANYHRHQGSELLQYTASVDADTLTTVVLKGTDFSYSERLGFEVVGQELPRAVGEVECTQRTLLVLVAPERFGEETLRKVSRDLDKLYPVPANLYVSFYTNIEQLRKANPSYARYYRPRLAVPDSPAGRHSLGAFFVRAPGTRYLSYTVYPFRVNSHGGLVTKRVELAW